MEFYFLDEVGNCCWSYQLAAEQKWPTYYLGKVEPIAVYYLLLKTAFFFWDQVNGQNAGPITNALITSSFTSKGYNCILATSGMSHFKGGKQVYLEVWNLPWRNETDGYKHQGVGSSSHLDSACYKYDV